MKKKSRDARQQQRSARRRNPLEILEDQRKAFEKKFCRPPGPGDPLFFDPTADEPTKLRVEQFDKEVLAAMQAAGTPPQIMYAFKKTGLLLSQELMNTYPADAVKEWEAAIHEYFAMEDKHEHSDASPEMDHGPTLPPTEIEALKGQLLSGKERRLVADSLYAIDDVLCGPVSVRTRLEVASMLLASACGAAFDSAAAQGHPEDAEKRYEFFEQLALLRARELFEGRLEE
jgi:hypothetical protein